MFQNLAASAKKTHIDHLMAEKTSVLRFNKNNIDFGDIENKKGAQIICGKGVDCIPILK